MTKLILYRRSLLPVLAVAAVAAPVRFPLAEEDAKPVKPTFVSLGEFTVNLPDDGGQMGYVVIGISMDVAPEAAGALNDIMPKLKDMVISRLMGMAAQGMLAPGHTDLVMIKTSLFDTLSRVNPQGIREVLITRLLYG